MVPMITYDDFAKIELKVAKILEAERVEGSDKLLKFKADIGSETRQILAGIGKKYNPEDLIGKEIIIVANLEPRALMGFESQGMLLAAGEGETLTLITVDREVPPGASIH